MEVVSRSAPSPGASRQSRLLRDRSLWFILIALALVSMLHYLTDIHLIPYHSIYRSLYYIPIAVGAVRYGRRGGIATALATSALYLPHVVLSWSTMPSDAFNDLLENVVFLFVGVFAGSLADAERVQRQRAQESARQLAASNDALTEQVDLSERMRTLVTSILESIDSGVITFDTNGRITSLNPAARQLVGAHVTNKQMLPRSVLTYLDSGARGYQTERIGEYSVGMHGSPLVGARGKQTGTVLVLDDLTEQRALEEQVQRAQRLAALGRLAGGLAHEIRNPLSITRAAAQMLAQQVASDPTLGEYTAVIQMEVDRVDRLIEQLLTYARPTVVYRGAIDIGELITRTVSLVKAYAAQQHIQLEAHVASELPAFEGDTELLHQVLVNLVLNGVQATPAGGRVMVTADSHQSEDDVALLITVSDTGRGISPEDLPRIFDPFFTSRHDGTGLGLSIVQQVVQEHHGVVDVESNLGCGTRFVLRLPIAKAATPSSSQQ